MTKLRPSKLADVMKDRTLMRFSLQFVKGWIKGYVLDIGPEFFLVAIVNDQIWLDGFACCRVDDVNELRRDPYRSFVESALSLRREPFPMKPEVSLANLEELLSTASLAFPLVSIHRELADPGVCHIGRVVRIESDFLLLHEIDPGAVWDETPSTYLLREITQVDFGGDYENALHLVGGNFSAP